MLDTLHVLAMVFASWRLTEALLYDRISGPLRNWLGLRAGRRPLWAWLHYLANCPRCASVEMGAIAAVLYAVWPWLNWPFALSWLFIVMLDVTGVHRAVQQYLRQRSLGGIPAISGGSTCVATNSSEFQTCLNTANYGDTISVTAGATFQGAFVAPNRGAGSSFITVQSSNMAGCPATDVRVDPLVHAAAMPKIVGDGPPAITVANGAHHWKFVCLEVTNTQSNLSTMLVTMDSSPPDAIHDIIFDRMWVHNPESTVANLHPDYGTTWASRGMTTAGCNTQVINSWIGSFAGVFPVTGNPTDSYGIVVQNIAGGSCQALIQNNRVEAFFNGIFPTGGGVDPAHTATISGPPTQTSATFSNTAGISVGTIIAVQVPDTYNDGRGGGPCEGGPGNPCWQSVKVTGVAGNVVSYSGFGDGALNTNPVNGGMAQWDGFLVTNLVINRNTLWKNPQWQVAQPGGAKDYIEIKACKNCSFTGNIFQGACGASVAWEIVNGCNNGGCPWTTCTNQTLQNNLFLGDVNGVFVPIGSSAQSSAGIKVSATPGSNINIINNLWTNVLFTGCGNNPGVSGFAQTAGGHDVTWRHNTVLNDPDIFYSSDGSFDGQVNTINRDSVFFYGGSGNNYNGPNGYQGAWPPNGIIEDHNVVMTASANNDPAAPGEYPNSNRVSTIAAIGFVNYTACRTSADYHGCGLAASSPWKNTASDGTDPGVNLTTLDAALAGGGPTAPNAPTGLHLI